MNASSPARRVTLGLTIPLMLVVSAAAELSLRFVPIGKFAFRSLEALASPDPAAGPFLPNRRYENAKTYGDLAGLSNLTSLRRYRREVFTTDRWGFRNSANALPAPPAAILVGDSFGIAPGVEDSQTLPAQLARLWNRGVYNAGGMFEPNDPQRVGAVAQRLGMKQGIVIYEYLERREMPPMPASDLRRERLRARMAEEEPATISEKLDAAARRFAASSRVRIVAEKTYRLAQNDRILPNPQRGSVVIGTLKNGDRILFLPEEIESSVAFRSIGVDYWLWAREQLSKNRLQLVVLLVPNKYTVYGPMLADRSVENPAGRDYLRRLEQELESAGIEAINLEPAYRALAAEGLGSRTYLYFLDDTHWTPLGMRIAAERIAALLARDLVAPDESVR